MCKSNYISWGSSGPITLASPAVGGWQKQRSCTHPEEDIIYINRYLADWGENLCVTNVPQFPILPLDFRLLLRFWKKERTSETKCQVNWCIAPLYILGLLVSQRNSIVPICWWEKRFEMNIATVICVLKTNTCRVNSNGPICDVNKLASSEIFRQQWNVTDDCSSVLWLHVCVFIFSSYAWFHFFLVSF